MNSNSNRCITMANFYMYWQSINCVLTSIFCNQWRAMSCLRARALDLSQQSETCQRLSTSPVGYEKRVLWNVMWAYYCSDFL